jgi:hypothetical protein
MVNRAGRSRSLCRLVAPARSLGCVFAPQKLNMEQENAASPFAIRKVILPQSETALD